jgi:hypothetical protein
MGVLNEVNEADFPYQAISDTITVCCTKRESFPDFMRLLKKMYSSFLCEGLLIRGGVAYSQHFKNSNVTYSHALALAYELESTKAIFPRIVIDPNIILMLEHLKIEESYKDLIAERNGIHFLDFVDHGNWGTLFEAAKRAYERDALSLRGNEAAFQKHLWVQQFLMEHPNAQEGASRYIPPTRFAAAKLSQD